VSERKRRIRVRFHAALNPGQATAWRSEATWTAYLGGWGAGKTFLGARAFLRNVLRNPRGVDAMLVAPFWSTVKRTTLREFKAVVPRGMITGESKGERYLEIVGRRVYYGSADRPETLDGPTVGAIWIDEGRYVKRRGWEVVLSRLRAKRARAKRGIITSTPGGEWLEEEFATGKKDRIAVHASTRENREHLGDSYIENLEASLSKRAARVFIEGEFGLIAGAVLEEWDRDWHLIDWKYDPRFRTAACLDFGYRRPYVGFAQHIPSGWKIPGRGTVPPGGAWVAFDEIIDENISTELLAMKVREKGYPLDVIWCDPAGDAASVDTGIPTLKTFKAALGGEPNVRYTTKPKWRHIPNGVEVLLGLLKNAREETRFWAAKSMVKPRATRGLVKDFEGYRYPEAKDGRPVGDMPVKDGLHDHGVDAWRYFSVGDALASGVLPDGIPAL
jgi:hypothetical protein